LFASIKRKEDCALFDSAAVESFRSLHPRNQATQRNYPFWDTSEASRLLEKDIDDGLHVLMTPKELYNTRQEYKEFPLAVFRKHIHQARQAGVQSSYWMHRKKLKEENWERNNRRTL
jgi:hypothetical protein